MDEAEATGWIVGTLRGEMSKRGISYRDLTERLAALGVEENERNLRNKVMRGTFSALFYVQCLVALGVRSLTLDAPEIGVQQVMRRADGTPMTKDEILAEIQKVLDFKDV